MKELEKFKDFLTSRDLIDLGLWGSHPSICLARLRGLTPKYVKIGKRIFYPKSEVIKYMNEKLEESRKILEENKKNYIEGKNKRNQEDEQSNK